ncbi:hypothetical protein N7495_009005 [Penicillium taxi]|uniref:uncharacterized protein n=1 Tax=Penicillium taxi TaxID=168475 RepID=UPI002545005B|nr:uncharacterized protein N7495_009005 [Penicillium taxi]KAJ5888964.1 hypothetical protein N7495_009005 [Penicillium taxi]
METSFQMEEPAFPMEEETFPVSLLDSIRKLRVSSADSDRSTSPFPEYKEEDETMKESEMQCSVEYSENFMAALTEDIRTNVVEPNVYVAVGQSDKKLNLLEDVKDHLAHPQLADSARGRFIALTNMVMRLQYILFKHTECFIHPVDVEDGMEIATTMMNYFTWVDNMLQDLVNTASNVSNVLAMLREEDVPPMVQYKRMVSVVSAHLRSPRVLEEKLLSLYMAMFDEWIHNLFLDRRSEYTTKEPVVDMGRLRITQSIHFIWEKILHSIHNYAIYRDALLRIRTEFFSCVMDDVHKEAMVAMAEDEHM